ncbi:5473_t:CDS:2, partial [Rhizophagus irregularis]
MSKYHSDQVKNIKATSTYLQHHLQKTDQQQLFSIIGVTLDPERIDFLDEKYE